MKTIEILIGDKTAYFTTKSVTLDDKEYLYSKMSGVNHFADKEEYVFTYEGDEISLPYYTEDAKVLNAIFSQIMKLPLANTAPSPAETTPEPETESKVEANAENEPDVEDIPKSETPQSEAEDDVKHDAEVVAEPEAEAEKSEFLTASAIQDAVENTPDDNSGETESTTDTDKKEKKSFKPAFKNPFAALKKKSDETPEAAATTEEVQPADPEKAIKLKKGLKNFIIVIAILVVLAVVYFFIFGTNKADSPTTPNVNESQQYDDIDDVIEKL